MCQLKSKYENTYRKVKNGNLTCNLGLKTFGLSIIKRLGKDLIPISGILPHKLSRQSGISV
jgi:hypothetical protein